MNTRALAISTVLLLLAAAAPTAGAQEGPHAIFLMVEDREYVPGQVLNFSVYTFAGSEPVSPASAPTVYVASGPMAGRTIPVCATAPGRYEGGYRVLSADADDHGYIDLEASANFADPAYGGTARYEGDYANVRLADSGHPGPTSGLSIRGRVLECPDGAVRPGSRLTVAVCATRDGAAVPAADLTFTGEHRGADGAKARAVIPAESPAAGYFLIHFTIPQQGHSDTFYFYADGYGITDNFITSVRLDFFNVVYHELARNGSRVDYELYVSDRAGAPVNGSGVAVVLRPWRSGTGAVALDLGKTDRGGRVKGLLDPGPDVGEVSMDGWANTSRQSQRFSGSVKLSNATPPQTFPTSGFNIERTATEGQVLAGGSAVLTYLATYNAEPVRLQALDCFLELYNGMPGSGVPVGVQGRRVLTDGQGRFSLNLSFPAGYYSYTTITAIGPGSPNSDRYGSHTDPDPVRTGPAAGQSQSVSWANVSFSKALAGRSCKLCATAAPGALLAARAGWDFRYNGTELIRPWAVFNTFAWYLQAGPSGKYPFRGQLVLPKHLRTGQDLTATVSFVNASGEQTTAAFPLKVRPAPALEPGADLCCITSIFMVNAMLIALLFFNYMTGRRGVRKKELEELGADDQIAAVLGGSRAAPRDLSLPIKIEMAQSEDCTACGRKIARGNLALRCVCGARYHEHCTGGGGKCPSCAREWKKG